MIQNKINYIKDIYTKNKNLYIVPSKHIDLSNISNIYIYLEDIFTKIYCTEYNDLLKENNYLVSKFTLLNFFKSILKEFNNVIIYNNEIVALTFSIDKLSYNLVNTYGI